MADKECLQVAVITVDRVVWEGDAINVITRTTEGDIGILPGHEPLMAILVPHAAEIVTADGKREIIALDGGFVSVAFNRVSLLSQEANLASEISVDDALLEFNQLSKVIDEGDVTDSQLHRYHLAKAQLSVAAKLK